jgi:hypothetical protein
MMKGHAGVAAAASVFLRFGVATRLHRSSGALAPALVVVASVLALAPASEAAPPAPKIDGAAIVRGAGKVKPDGARDWHDTTTGDVLTSGVSVQAADDQPLELSSPDGVTITLEPGAQARWLTAGKLPSETNTWTRGYHLVLREGELEVSMPPGPKGSHAFLVSTKAGTLTDWRGQLHINVHDETTTAAIYEGALVVGSNGMGFPVYDGAGILMRKGHDPDKSRAIPPAPTWDSSANAVPSFAVVQGAAHAPLGIAWAAVQGAATYRVEVATEGTMTRVVHRATTTDAHYTLPDITVPNGSGGTAAPPRLFAHVRAVGSEGIVGQWSAARALHVVHYPLPDGAFVAKDGAIVLPDGASVTLSDADGIEVAFENVTSLARRTAVPLYWSKLSGPLRLSDDAPMRIVHLRDPVLGAETQLVLAKSALRADVQMSPKNARWPADAIDVRVVVADPSGRVDPASVELKLQALLGIVPVSVSWQRSGATWTTHIASNGRTGPSVVRVVAADAKGTEIGRGFLEIGAASP